MMFRDSVKARTRAARIIKAGGLIAFRTDTFYGLGADPFNREALTRIKTLKGRDAGKPILVIISDPREVGRFISERSRLFDALSARFWPGALTLVAQVRAEVPEELTAGTRTIGLRLPGDESVRELLAACGGALTATSANTAGQPPARTALEVAGYFPTGLDMILDGGETISDKPSTVVDASGDSLRMIREGVITREQLSEILN